MSSKSDYLNSRAGARHLARTITAYWHKKGQTWVKAYEVEVPYGNDFIWTVKSNLAITKGPKGYTIGPSSKNQGESYEDF